MLTNANNEASINLWAVYNDGAVTIPIDGTGGSSTLSVPTLNTTTPLSGTQDIIFTHPSSNCQGQGWSQDFTIDSQYLGQYVTLSFPYKAQSTYAGDVSVFIYDKTNGIIITPDISVIPSSLSVAQFSTSFTPNSTSNSYRFIIHITTVNTVTFTLEVDTLQIAPRTLMTGSIVSDWNPYTMNITATSNPTKGTVIQEKSLWRRVGGNIEIEYSYSQSASGVNGTGNYYFSLPLGYTVDLTKVGTKDILGIAYFSTSSDQVSISTEEGVILTDSSGNIYAQLKNTDTAINSIVGSAIYGMGNVYLSYHFRFTTPISQWVSNINLITDFTEYAYNSDVTATASVTASGFANGPQGINFSSNWTIGTTWARRVRFKNPIKDSDIIICEFYDGQEWYDLNRRVATYVANTTQYGVSFPNIGVGTLTDMDIFFGNGGNAYGAATYGANGQAWSFLSAYKWRVRKISNGNMAEATLVNSQIGNWTQFSPASITNIPGSWTRSLYRRVGSSIELDMTYTASGASTGVMALNIDTLLSTLGLTKSITTGTMISYPISANSSGVTELLGNWDGLNFYNGSSPWQSTTPFTWKNLDTLILHCSIPIADWGSNINLITDFTEYASNNSAAGNASDTTFSNSVSGPQGSLFPGNQTAAHTRWVRFAKPVQPTDKLYIEISSDGGVSWTDLSYISNVICKYKTENVTGYGMGINSVSGTDVVLYIGGYSVSDGTTYAGAGSAWSAFSTYKWRVRKVSNGNFAQANPNVNVIQPITSIQSTGFTYTIPLIPLQTSIVYIPVACAKSSGSAFNITISNGTSSVLINIPASSPTPTVSAITSTLFCDASGILTLQGDITSSGSNSNGSYIQFADGTIECWGIQVALSVIQTTFTFPTAFSSNALVFPTLDSLQSEVEAIGTQNRSITGFILNAAVVGGSMSVSYRAIGRWK